MRQKRGEGDTEKNTLQFNERRSKRWESEDEEKKEKAKRTNVDSKYLKKVRDVLFPSKGGSTSNHNI